MACFSCASKPLTSSIWGSTKNHGELTGLELGETSRHASRSHLRRKQDDSQSSGGHLPLTESKLEDERQTHKTTVAEEETRSSSTYERAKKWSVELKTSFVSNPAPLRLSLGVYPYINLDPLGVFSTDDTYINVDPLGFFSPFVSGGTHAAPLKAPVRSSDLPKIRKRSPRIKSVPSVSQLGKHMVAAAIKLQAELSTLEKPKIPGFAPSPRPDYTMDPRRRPRRNKFLDGNFRPVAGEQAEEVECCVLGTIPDGLRGRFIRNGPNPQFPPTPNQYHWFDGDGMVHCVRFHDKGVSYSSRYIETAAFIDERVAGHPLYVGLGGFTNFVPVMHLRSMLSRAMRSPRIRDTPPWCGMKNPANNHLIMHAGRLLALWEAGLPYELDAAQLSTKGVQAFNGKLTSSFTAHPKMDPQTGHLMYYGYNLLSKPYLQYGVIDKSGDIVHRADIDLNAPVYMHDFAITENYTLFLDFPVVFSIERMVQSHGTCKPFHFDPEHPARIGVMPRFGDNSSVIWFRTEPGFVNHVMNAYEETSDGSFGLPPGGTTVVLHGSRFQAFSALNMADMPSDPNYANNQVCRLHEWRLHLPSGKVVERPISPVCSDFLCINPSYTGKKHRYGYSAHYEMQPGPGNATPMFDGMIKHDVTKATVEVHSFGADRYGGEPIFVPNQSPPRSPARKSHASKLSPAAFSQTVGVARNIFPLRKLGGGDMEAVGRGEEVGAKDRREDDGWIIAHVWDDYQQQSEVVIVDAKNVEGPPVARVLLPRRVPYGFHGIFVEENK